MCRFEYHEYSPCGCQVYHGNKDVQFCDTEIKSCDAGADTSGWVLTVLVRHTDKYGDIDYGDGFRHFVTRGQNRFPYLHCKEHTYVRQDEPIERSECFPCPWHDDAIRAWMLMKRKGQSVPESKEKRQKKSARKQACVSQ